MAPERVDIDCQEGRVRVTHHLDKWDGVRVTHHLDKWDGVTEKQSIRERLRGTKAPKQENPAEKEIFQEVEIS